MAYYAYLDENNIVVTVISGRDENETIDGLDPETYYAQGTSFRVKRTSFNARIRKNFAGIGMIYDETRDAFIPIKCHDQAVLDDETCQWSCDNNEHNRPTL